MRRQLKWTNARPVGLSEPFKPNSIQSEIPKRQFSKSALLYSY